MRYIPPKSGDYVAIPGRNVLNLHQLLAFFGWNYNKLIVKRAAAYSLVMPGETNENINCNL